MGKETLKNIVHTDVEYNSNILAQDIAELKEKYPFIHVDSIGKSVLREANNCFESWKRNKRSFL